MKSEVIIAAQDPTTPPARAMLDALWDEIQRRYGFNASNGIRSGRTPSGRRPAFTVGR